MKKRFGIKTKIFLVLLVLLIAVPVVIYIRMPVADAQHAEFFETGKTVKSFVGKYGKAVKAAHAAQDASYAHFYAENYYSPGRGSWMLGAPEMVGGVATRYLKVVGKDDFNRDSVLAEWQQYYGGLKKIEVVHAKIHLIEEIDYDKVVLTVKWVMDAIDLADQPIQVRHFYRWHLDRMDMDEHQLGWRITRDELVEGVRVSRVNPVFVKADLPAAGVDYVHRRDPKLDIKKYGDQMKFAVVEHAMGGVSAADYDHDGRPDLFFADGVQSRLYRNITQKDGAVAFEDVTRSAGLEGLDQAATGIFADFDNDGDDDLFVTRYLAPNAMYINNGSGVFTERAGEMGLDFVGPSISATLLDYDLDGFTDIYVGLNGQAFEAFPRLPFYARNGKANRLFRNNGGKGFEDVTGKTGVGDTGWTLAVATADVNGDGWPDLGVANDFGRKNIYRNNGDGTFDEVSKELGTLDFSGGMGLVFADFNDDGLEDLYTSNIKSNQRWFGEDQTIGQYINNVMRTKWMVYDFFEYMALYRLKGDEWPELGKEVGEGNSLFYNNGDDTFRELKDSHTNQAGWSWSVAAVDFDNDSDLDIYAANGWISNKPDTDL